MKTRFNPASAGLKPLAPKASPGKASRGVLALLALFSALCLCLAMTDAAAADRPMLPKVDNVEIRGYTLAGPGHAIRGTLAGGACALLTVRPDTRWDRNSPCKVMQIMNEARLGRLVPEGPDGFFYQAKAAGTETIRYVVDNTQGRRAVVTLYIEVIDNTRVVRAPPRGSAELGPAGPEAPAPAMPPPSAPAGLAAPERDAPAAAPK